MHHQNRKQFEHRVQTIIGQLRIVLKKVEENPSDAYGQLHSIERSVVQAKMFIVKDLIDALIAGKNKGEQKTAVAHLYDCLGFHRDELPPKSRQ